MSALLGDGTPVNRVATGKGARSKAARLRAALRQQPKPQPALRPRPDERGLR